MFKHCHVECTNNVRGGENCPSGRFNRTLLGLCETRWTQSGQLRLTTGEIILYSGHEEDDAPHSEGLPSYWGRSHIEHLLAGNQLLDIMSNLGDKNINLIMGDFNAKIGLDNQGYENVMGVHGLGVMNDNAERFVNACAINNIVIGGSVFTHKRIHKATWVSPDQVTENQIDHIGINKMFRRSPQDVRVKRGADVASDHHLVTARLKLKLRRNGVEQERRKARYNVDFLKDPRTAEEYKVALANTV